MSRESNIEFARNQKIVAERKRQREEKLKDNSKQRLMTIIQKKFVTVSVGALEDFEKAFGHIWGHGLREDELTDTQARMREIWAGVRTSILDRGNSNKRASKEEIGQYDISWNRFNTRFVMKRGEG